VNFGLPADGDGSGRGDDHDPGSSVSQGAFTDVARPLNVCLIQIGTVGRIPSDKAGQVEDSRDTLYGPIHGAGIQDIPVKNFNARVLVPGISSAAQDSDGSQIGTVRKPSKQSINEVRA